MPLRDAIVLDRYGHRDVIVLDQRITGLHGVEFVPAAEIKYAEQGVRRMYAIRHVCGTRHDPR